MSPKPLGRRPLGKHPLGSRKASVRLGQILDTSSPASGTFVAAYSGFALIYLWGAGASGRGDAPSPGGGGGGGAYRRVPVIAGQRLDYVVGAGGISSSGAGVD